jgi:mucin-19
VTAFNDLEAADDVRLDTGGAIVGSGVTSHVTADDTAAAARVGAGAAVTADGDVNLTTRTRAVVTVEPQAHTYGLAAAAVVDALGRVKADNRVEVGAGAKVTAYGQLNLLAGRDAGR